MDDHLCPDCGNNTAFCVCDQRRTGEHLADKLAEDPTALLLAQIVDWATFWGTDVTAEDWVAWPLVATGRQTALFAPAKAGKSLVALAVVAAAATGTSILGRRPAAPVDVLYLDYEMTVADLRERLELLGYDETSNLSHLHYVVHPDLPPMHTKTGAKQVVTMAQAVGAAIVVVDTMNRAIEGEESKSDAYLAFARTTGMLLKAAGIALLRTDHAGKDRDRGQRGSSAKNDDVDIVMRLDVTEGGYKLVRTHARPGWVPTEVVITQHHLSDGMHLSAVEKTKTYTPGTADLADHLRELGVTASTPRRKAHELLVAADGQGVKASRLSDALAWIRDSEPFSTGNQGREPLLSPTFGGFDTSFNGDEESPDQTSGTTMGTMGNGDAAQVGTNPHTDRCGGFPEPTRDGSQSPLDEWLER